MSRRSPDAPSGRPVIDNVEAPIKPLIESLSFIKNKTHWGSAFRFGYVKVPAEDCRLIAAAMGVESAFQQNAPCLPIEIMTSGDRHG